tara:strand:+ start:506 stop:943 length:438 start_codon:yes stop_codon:yes gene_type:complete
MPTAKPTQIIVHRIELQSTERKYLEEYIKNQSGTSPVKIADTLLKNAGTISIAVAVGGVGYLGYRAYMAVQESLMSLNPVETLKEMKEDAPRMKRALGLYYQKKAWVEAGKPTDKDGKPILPKYEEPSYVDLYMVGFNNFWGLEN